MLQARLEATQTLIFQSADVLSLFLQSELLIISLPALVAVGVIVLWRLCRVLAALWRYFKP